MKDMFLWLAIPLLTQGVNSDEYGTREQARVAVELLYWANIPEPYQTLAKSDDPHARDVCRQIQDNLRPAPLLRASHLRPLGEVKWSPNPALLLRHQDRLANAINDGTMTAEQKWHESTTATYIYLDELIAAGASPAVAFLHALQLTPSRPQSTESEFDENP